MRRVRPSVVHAGLGFNNHGVECSLRRVSQLAYVASFALIIAASLNVCLMWFWFQSPLSNRMD